MDSASSGPLLRDRSRTWRRTSLVAVTFAESDGKLADGVIDLRGFGPYDAAMHDFGSWHDETYPDEEPIHGIHYRGWNVEDPGAAERFVEHLDEWIASL